MNDEPNIPLLKDLVSRGQVEPQENHLQVDSNKNLSIEITADEIEFKEELPDEITADSESQKEINQPASDELIDDASVRELIIDEEIRMILDKHMDKAYEEIICLLKHKIS